MRAVIQRVSRASVTVGGEVVGCIERGLLVLLGVEQGDTQDDVVWMANKVVGLRVFEDAEGKMNLEVGEVGGAILAWRIREGRVPGATSRAGLSRRLRPAFAALGPAYIKLGQIISSGRGLFPEELVDEFKKCRDQVPAISFEAVRRVVESDLGQPLEAVFSEFDRVPLAAASIAQVHLARLTDGTPVAVKVQYPWIESSLPADLAMIRRLVLSLIHI